MDRQSHFLFCLQSNFFFVFSPFDLVKKPRQSSYISNDTRFWKTYSRQYISIRLGLAQANIHSTQLENQIDDIYIKWRIFLLDQ